MRRSFEIVLRWIIIPPSCLPFGNWSRIRGWVTAWAYLYPLEQWLLEYHLNLALIPDTRNRLRLRCHEGKAGMKDAFYRLHAQLGCYLLKWNDKEVTAFVQSVFVNSLCEYLFLSHFSRLLFESATTIHNGHHTPHETKCRLFPW